MTVDDELADALARIEPMPASKSRLVRYLALRGAVAVQQERDRADEALTVLLEIADGTRDYDFAAAADLVSHRADRLR